MHLWTGLADGNHSDSSCPRCVRCSRQEGFVIPISQMRTLRHRRVERFVSPGFLLTPLQWYSALGSITFISLHLTGTWTVSHFTEVATEAQKTAAELGEGTRPSDARAERASRQEAQLGRGQQGHEWASASSSCSSAEPWSLQRVHQVRGPWARRRGGCACVGAGEGPRQAEPHAQPPSHSPFLPWLVAGEWVSRNRQAAEKTGRRRNQITHLQLRLPRANKS